MSPLKIGIVVQGRFHAFDLGRALLNQGHDVTVFTNYPTGAAAKFGIAASRVRSFTRHGVLARGAMVASRATGAAFPEQWLHEMFGRWAARELARDSWDVVHCWSGISEEFLQTRTSRSGVALLMRGSSHILAQSRLLEAEAARSGISIDRPTPWMIRRELREYAMADRVVVLSSFALDSCLAEGIPESRLALLPLGVETTRFRASPEVIAARVGRLRRPGPLKVLYVGALSLRKGLLDLAAIAEGTSPEAAHFTLVGGALPEAAAVLARLGSRVTVLGKVKQSALPPIYHAADVFLFPTIEDGFPVVMAQAKAAGLPILTTPNGAGRDIVQDGLDGWIRPIRTPAAFIELLERGVTAAGREALVEMTEKIGDTFRPRDWDVVAEDFVAIAGGALTGGSRLQAPPASDGKVAP